MDINRRDYLKLAGVIGAGAVISLYAPTIKKVFAEAVDEKRVVWLQGSSDTGCTISLLQGVSPDLVDVIQLLTKTGYSLDFHPTIMIPAGDTALGKLTNVDLLIVEGAIPDGNYCTVGEYSDGTPVPFKDWVTSLGKDATYIVAVGTCAAFGGIPAARPNPTGCIPVSEALQQDVINIPGCPPHPDWITLTLAAVLDPDSPPPKLDPLGRPREFFQDSIHTNCPLKSRYYENGKYASFPSDPGCLYRLGCKGKKTLGDCPIRLWNNGVSTCTAGRWSNEDTQVYPAGAPCIGCTEPEFPEDPFSPFYEKLREKER